MIPLSKLDRMKQDQLILKPFVYIYDVPNIFHKTIVLAFNYWLNAPEDKVNQIEEITRVTHTNTLILDDIQDNSDYRYGSPSAHQVYGIGLTINALCHALGIAFKKVAALDHPKALEIYLNAYEDAFRGQGIELCWRDKFQCPTEEEYIDMLKQKSSNMLVGIVQLLQLFSDCKENYQEIAIMIGVYYSLRDDYCNLFNRESLKVLADNPNAENIHGDSDITDGKFTLPIIHSLQTSDNAEEIMNILKQRTSDLKIINHCISLLEKNGSAKYCEDVLRRTETDIENEINRLGGNPKLVLILEKLRWRRNHEE